MKKSSIDTPISLAEAARLVGKSKTWLNKLVNDGYMKRLERGLYRPCDVAQGVLRFMQDERRRSSTTATLAQVQAMRAKEIAQRIAAREHESIDLAEALDVLDEIVGGMKSGFDGVAAACSRDAQLRIVIQEKIDAVLEQAAARLAQRERSLRESGEAFAAEEEDAAGSVGGEA
jgi:hypothetical protein